MVWIYLKSILMIVTFLWIKKKFFLTVLDSSLRFLSFEYIYIYIYIYFAGEKRGLLTIFIQESIFILFTNISFMKNFQLKMNRNCFDFTSFSNIHLTLGFKEKFIRVQVVRMKSIYRTCRNLIRRKWNGSGATKFTCFSFPFPVSRCR